MKSTFVLAIVALGAVACSSNSSGSTSGGTDDDTGTTADDTATDEVSDDTGSFDDTNTTPCGKNVGDVLCDLDVQGYLSLETTGLASAQPVTQFKISDVLAQGTQPYAFVFNSAFW